MPRCGRSRPHAGWCIRRRTSQGVRASLRRADVPVAVGGTARLRQEQRLPREAWVTIWGLRSIHQFLRLPPAVNTELEALSLREARRNLSTLESEAGRASAALMIGADVQVGTHRRREVSLTAVPEAEITRQIQPLIDAGSMFEASLRPRCRLRQWLVFTGGRCRVRRRICGARVERDVRGHHPRRRPAVRS